MLGRMYGYITTITTTRTGQSSKTTLSDRNIKRPNRNQAITIMKTINFARPVAFSIPRQPPDLSLTGNYPLVSPRDGTTAEQFHRDSPHFFPGSTAEQFQTSNFPSPTSLAQLISSPPCPVFSRHSPALASSPGSLVPPQPNFSSPCTPPLRFST